MGVASTCTSVVAATTIKHSAHCKSPVLMPWAAAGALATTAYRNARPNQGLLHAPVAFLDFYYHVEDGLQPL